MQQTNEVVNKPFQRGRHYAVLEVEKTDSPIEDNPETWYRYVVNDGNSTITGLRCGTKKQVTDYAKKFAKDLNERGTSSSSVWATRSAAKPAQAKPAQAKSP